MTGWIHKTELNMTWQEAHGLTRRYQKPIGGLRTIQLLLSMCKIWAANSSAVDTLSLLGCHIQDWICQPQRVSTYCYCNGWRMLTLMPLLMYLCFNSHSEFSSQQSWCQLMHYRAAQHSCNSCYILCRHWWHTLKNGNLQHCKWSKSIWQAMRRSESSQSTAWLSVQQTCHRSYIAILVHRRSMPCDYMLLYYSNIALYCHIENRANCCSGATYSVALITSSCCNKPVTALTTVMHL